MAKQLTAFCIDRGIAKYEFDDYFAVLGLPVTSTPQILRQRYIQVTKLLHPDLSAKPNATAYLAKLVNPAYKILNQERERSEYLSLLRLLAKRLIKQSLKDFTLSSEPAKQLMVSPNVLLYERMVKEIARSQYENLEKTLEHTGWLSELNLIYLLMEEGCTHFYQTAKATTPVAIPVKEDPFVKRTQDNSFALKQHIAAAEQHIKVKLWTLALKELRSALQLDNHNSKCHALLGVVYLNQNVIGMAKVSFQQALKANPQETIALEGMKKLQEMTKSDPSSKSSNGTHKKEKNSKNDKDKGGFFGWLGNG